jgi:hypothetical protein
MEYPLLEVGIIVASDLSVYRFDTGTWTTLPIRLAEFLAVGMLPRAPSPRAVVCFDVDYEAVRNPRPSVQCAVLQIDGSGIGILPTTVVGDGFASARQLPYAGDFRYFAHTVAASCAVRASAPSTATEPSIKIDCRPVKQNFTPLAEYAVADGFVVLSATDDGILCRREYRNLQADLVREQCYQLTDARGVSAPFPRLPDRSWLRAFETGSGTNWKLSIFGAAVEPKFSFGLKPR